MPEEVTTPETAAIPSPPVATIGTLAQHDGQSVTLRGWLYNLRESGKLLFPIFRDGTGTVQGVAHVKSVSPEVFAALKKLSEDSELRARMSGAAIVAAKQFEPEALKERYLATLRDLTKTRE